MLIRLCVLLLLGGCAGRDTPAGAWVFWDQKQKPGDPSAFAVLADEYAAAPVATSHGVGTVIGAAVGRLLVP